MVSSEDMGPRLSGKRLVLAVVMLCCCGCPPEFSPSPVPAPGVDELLKPMTIKIHDLSRVVRRESGEEFDGLIVACEIRDRYGSRVKALGVMRFEVYSYARSQPNNKGPRVRLWNERIDSDEAIQKYWDDVFGVYRFSLNWTRQVNLRERFIVEATLTTKEGKQLSDRQVLEVRR